jgi:hypothetical protein
MYKVSREDTAQAGKSNWAEIPAVAPRETFESKTTVATPIAEASRILQVLYSLENPIRTMVAHSTSGKVPDEGVTAIAGAATQCVSAPTAGPAAAPSSVPHPLSSLLPAPSEQRYMPL